MDRIHREKPLPETLQKQLPRLVELGVIEKAARGRYMLSRRFYAETGKKGAYTRKKGLDSEEAKALLLKHIQTNRDEGAQLAELCQVLPSRTSRQVRALLQELRQEGCITAIGKTKFARWFPASENS